MIHIYAFSTPNSVKVPIALEEMGLEYQIHAVNTKAGEQRAGAVMALNPNFEQLFFHASALSPAFGQSGYFQKSAAEKSPIAIARFGDEAKRVMQVLDGVLAERTYTAGEGFSIADIAHFGWLWRRAFPGIELDDTPNVKRWYEQVSKRPGVIKAIAAVEGLVP
jgi:GSH-dependent disulfide-bond oxidoreductase